MRRSIRLRPGVLDRMQVGYANRAELAAALGIHRTSLQRHVEGSSNDEPSNALIAGVWSNRCERDDFDDLFEVVEISETVTITPVRVAS